MEIKNLVEELIEVSKGLILEPYQKDGNRYRQIYMIKRVQVKGKEGYYLAYNRWYKFIGMLSRKDFDYLISSCKISQTWPNYLGGLSEPSLDDVMLVDGQICGDSFWIAPKDK
ncbi:MAG: hypothetical protein AABY84_13045 [Candidatus Firestonebacteria bacterium]